ncbi:hypothetical protein [uncultured Friedmanniella sp.]
MAQNALFLAAWIATGSAGLVFGIVAVGMAKRRLLKSEIKPVTDQPVTA